MIFVLRWFDIRGSELEVAAGIFASWDVLKLIVYTLSPIISLVLIIFFLLSLGWKAKTKYALGTGKAAVYGAVGGGAGFAIWLIGALLILYYKNLTEARSTFDPLTLLVSIVLDFVLLLPIPLLIGFASWMFIGAVLSAFGNILAEKKREWA